MPGILPPPPPRTRPDFSLTTVNIVLLLLLFFLVAGDPADRGERAIVPPVTQDLPREGLPRPLLTLQPDGDLALDGVAVTRADLRRRVAAGELDQLHLLGSRTHSARELLALVGPLTAEGAGVRLVTLRPGDDAEAGRAAR